MTEYLCSGCGYKSDKKRLVVRHIQHKETPCSDGDIEIIVLPGKIICQLCVSEFKSKESLDYHIKDVHKKRAKDVNTISTTTVEEELKILKEEVKQLKSEKENAELKEEIKELKEEIKEYKKLKKGALNSIRAKARKKYIKHFDLICVHCKNSDKTIIEICHIKPVSEFSVDSIIESEINALHNLISLCPNCHTGLDKSKNPEIIKTAKEHSEKILSLNLI